MKCLVINQTSEITLSNTIQTHTHMEKWINQILTIVRSLFRAKYF